MLTIIKNTINERVGLSLIEDEKLGLVTQRRRCHNDIFSKKLELYRTTSEYLYVLEVLNLEHLGIQKSLLNMLYKKNTFFICKLVVC